MAKATFYRHFRSKDAFLRAVLEARDRRLCELLEQRVLAVAPRAIDRPLAVFDVLAEWMQEPHYRGCAFLNSMIEIADPEHPVHAATQRHKSKLAQMFTRFLRAAGNARAENVADQLLLLLLDGALVTSLREGGFEAALRARSIARTLVEPRTPIPSVN